MINEHRIAEFMSLAAADALEGMKKGDGGPFGALICRGEEIISIGHNSVFLHSDPSAHAEITAIRAACKELGRLFLDDCTLITTCEPCPMCLGAIFWARIPRVIYSSTRMDAEAAGFIDRHIYEALQSGTTGDIEMIHFEHDARPDLFKTWLKLEQMRPY
jgi:tRNA(Arg) A34 adenosine deaminase TadA